jgi:hypothetical protein
VGTATNSRTELSLIRSKAGRIGGLQTLMRHGREHYSRIGRLHRRPKFEELLNREIGALEALKSEYERRMARPGNSLRELKERYKLWLKVREVEASLKMLKGS